MIRPFFAHCDAAAGDVDTFDEVIEQIPTHAAYLRGSYTGLPRHAWIEQPNHYPQDALWVRDNGWAVAASANVLEWLPEGHLKRDDFLDLFRPRCEALLPLQDGSSFWHNLVDNPHTPPEPSGTLMLAYAFARGINLGALDAETYRRPAEDGFAAVSRVVGEEGTVNRVAGLPGGSEALPTDMPHGQGWFLVAAAALDWDLRPQRSF